MIDKTEKSAEVIVVVGNEPSPQEDKGGGLTNNEGPKVNLPEIELGANLC